MINKFVSSLVLAAALLSPASLLAQTNLPVNHPALSPVVQEMQTIVKSVQEKLKAHAGKQIAAPKAYGRGSYKAIEPAPGRYVKARAGT